MAKHDVHLALDGRGYLLDVQTDLLSGIDTRVVVPLLPQPFRAIPVRRLNPVFRIGDTEHVMATQFLVAIPARLLKAPVTSLGAETSAIADALDMLLQGF